MEKYYEIMSHCPLFKDIKLEEYTQLMSCINYHIKAFKSNEYLFFAGEQVNYLGIVLTGMVEIIKETPAGTKHIVDFLTSSHVFAEGIVCTKERISPVTVRTRENSTILFIPFERIVYSCSSSCSFHLLLIKNMMMILGEKNFGLNRKIELLNLKGMREKIATYLLYEFQKKNTMTFEILPNRNELAEYLDVSRTSMSRELSKMKTEGIIDYYLNTFRILSLDSLKACLKDD